MVSELLCWDILKSLYGRVSRLSLQGEAADASPRISEERNALSDSSLVRPLLTRYDLAAIDAGIRWLWLGQYIGKTSLGLDGPWVHTLTPKGIQTVESGGFSEEERRLFYGQVRPYQVFLAHQFSPDDQGLVEALRDAVLIPAGYSVVDGQAEGLEEFRQGILGKIAGSQFFLCLLTRRSALATGGFASSVWLYQEIGAAVALGRAPLVLVEDGIDSHYAGELQKTYEYILFPRDNFRAPFEKVLRRFEAHLAAKGAPPPRARVDGGAA